LAVNVRIRTGRLFKRQPNQFSSSFMLGGRKNKQHQHLEYNTNKQRILPLVLLSFSVPSSDLGYLRLVG